MDKSSVLAVLAALACLLNSCGGARGNAYNFTVSGKTRLGASSRRQTPSTRTNSSCSSMFCLTPTAISGKYFGTGLLIQSGGDGMSAYFGNETWSEVTGLSATYSFDLATPVTNSGSVKCCTGSANLSGANTYFEDVAFLIGYLDATFTLDAGTGVTGTAIGTHTVRFIFADDVVPSAKRGDLMYSDSGTFKWMSTMGVLSALRPTSPITMDSAVVNWVNPWGSTGNEDIPVIYAPVREETDSTEKLTVTEEELKTTSRTYSFTFPSAEMVIFPTVLANQDESTITSIKVMLTKIHLRGLPHSTATIGKASTAALSISE